MTLQTRTLLMVTLLLVTAVLAAASVMTWTARQSLLAQTEADGLVIARLLTRSAMFAEQIPRDVEDAIGEQMIVEATIAAHLVGIAEDAGLSPDEINSHLRAITTSTVLDEFWITDETGHAYLRNIQEIDFTFNPDPAEQPQAHVFWPLLTGEADAVVQEARQREVDTQVFKYAGVAGVDQSRIVQVGYHATFLENLRQQVGLNRLVDELMRDGNINAIRVVDSDTVTVVYSAVPGMGLEQNISEADAARLEEVIRRREPASHLDGDTLKVMAPIIDSQGQVTGATLVILPTDHVRATIRHQLELAAVVAAFVLAIGLLTSVILSRRVTEPVAQITAAAAAIEAETFEPENLSDVAQRTDELGQLARVFQRMAREVYAREQRLKQQIQELRIEVNEARKAQQVTEITDTEYFQKLQKRAQDLRSKTGHSDE
jgi:hypothetical protein